MGRLYSLALYVIAPFAMLAVVLHILLGLACVSLIFRLLPQGTRNRIMRLWSRVLLRLVGIRLEVSGVTIEKNVVATGISALSKGRLLLINHGSWADIFAIDAVVPTRFIAKSEIASWPMVGWLVSLSGTLFVERGRRHAVALINRALEQQLQKGETVGVFPEGTTTSGETLLPFHSNLIQPALQAGAEIRPVALRYTQNGRRSEAAAYIGDMNLVQSLWSVLTAPKLAVELIWLPALSVSPNDNRHAVARAAREAIVQALGMRDEINPASVQAAMDIEPAPASGPASEAR